ncbi:MAG: zinc ribbon domain-containing protein [Armatimonadota bacterium]|nr:MAG: zinc ribbon domain-containing protein [Armatimonadota bacterium]
MQAGISWIMLILMSLNLSPQGPPELRAGSFWTYRVEGEGNLTMSILEASPSDAGMMLKVVVSPRPPVSVPIVASFVPQMMVPFQVVLAPDRKSIKAWMDVVGSRDTEVLDLAMPELKVGSRWELAEAGAVTITGVQPEPTITPAGSFPNAVKVSWAIQGQARGTVWIAPGVGFVAVGIGSERDLELTEYGVRPPGAVSGKRITIEFKDTPVMDAIEALIGDAPVSIAFRDIPEDLRVTATIRDASPEEAVMLVCAAAGLEWEDVGRDGGVIRMPPSVSVGGARVPVVGAMSVGSRVSPTAPLATEGPFLTTRLQVPTEARSVFQDLARPTFEGDDKLVDLDVKDAPIREAMTKLSEASGIPIHVAEPVSNELKVTAAIYRMPIGDVLAMIVNQAGLAYTVSYRKPETLTKMRDEGLISGEDYAARKGNPEIHIVPKPELRVTGPGAPGAALTWNRILSQAPSLLYRLQSDDATRAALTILGQGQQTPSVVGVPESGATCTKCGREALAPDWKFCPACGAPSPHPEEPAEEGK